MTLYHVAYVINFTPSVHNFTSDSSPQSSSTTPSNFFRRFSQQTSPTSTTTTLSTSNPDQTTSTGPKKIVFSQTEIKTMVWALNVILQLGGKKSSDKLTLSTFNHYEYFPYQPARLHNTSLAITNLTSGVNSQTTDLTTNIANTQLKEQYQLLLKYILMTSANTTVQPTPVSTPSTDGKKGSKDLKQKTEIIEEPVVVETPNKLTPESINSELYASLSYHHILSLIYYTVILQQAPTPQILSLLRALLHKLSSQKHNIFTSHIQFAYMLCYLDILWGGTLHLQINQDQIQTLAELYPNIIKPDTYPKSTDETPVFFFASYFSFNYKTYAIPQWSTLFSQTQQYLIDGRVDLIATLTGINPNVESDKTDEIKYDENQKSNTELQRMIRQDQASSSAPSLSCNIKHTPTTTELEIVYNNHIVDSNFDLYVYYIDSELLLSQKPFMQSSSNTTSGTKNQENEKHNFCGFDFKHCFDL
jgi:hypothetical protein